MKWAWLSSQWHGQKTIWMLAPSRVVVRSIWNLENVDSFCGKKNASRTVWMANDYIMILICCRSSANGREWVLLFGLFNFLGTAYLSPNQLQ